MVFAANPIGTGSGGATLAAGLGAMPEFIGVIVAASTITGVFFKLPSVAFSDCLSGGGQAQRSGPRNNHARASAQQPSAELAKKG